MSAGSDSKLCLYEGKDAPRAAAFLFPGVSLFGRTPVLMALKGTNRRLVGRSVLAHAGSHAYCQFEGPGVEA